MVIDFGTLYDFPREISRIFDDFDRPLAMNRRRIAYPLVNVSETQDQYTIDVNVPGVDKDALDVTIMKNSLVIKGARPEEQGRFYRRERLSGDFQRIVALASPVDRDKTTATYANGILTIVVPKAEAAIPKKIAIEA